MTSRSRRLGAVTATLALLALGAVGCSSGDDRASSSAGADSSEVTAASAPDGSLAYDADEAADEAAEVPAAEAPVDAEAFADRSAADLGTARSASGSVDQAAQVDNTAAQAEPGDPRSLIRTGNVALRAADVGAALFEVRKVLAETRGEVSQENTEADEQGEAERSLLTVRVPVGQFDTALAGLKDLGVEQDGVDLIDSSSTTEDVSTQVIDTGVRVELQRRSIERISVLLDRATSIRDIVGIERELARREADLGSLQKRQAFLADQTSMSTITISIERPQEKKAAETRTKDEKKDDSGFFAGLENGWDAFEDVTTGLLTSIGALLPFGILALVVGIPLRVWLRRRQAATPASTPDTAVAGA